MNNTTKTITSIDENIEECDEEGKKGNNFIDSNIDTIIGAKRTTETMIEEVINDLFNDSDFGQMTKTASTEDENTDEIVIEEV